MGTINYGKSDYITLGSPIYYPEDYDQEDIDDICIDDLIAECYEADYENVKFELEKHYFYYYNISIKPGYYEGFYIDIENNFPTFYDSWEDRREAQKEITEIKQFLTELAGLGIVSWSHGWCASHKDYKGTLKDITSAIKYMRDEVKSIPTYNQYFKDQYA